MTKFNLENDMNYISEMTEEEKIIFLQILVYLAKIDKNFETEEKDFITDLAIIFGIKADKRDEISKSLTEEELIELAKKIKNRQTSLQLIKECCMLANSDSDLSDEEIIFIGKIGLSMNIELEKIEQISKWVVDRLVWIEEGKLIFELF